MTNPLNTPAEQSSSANGDSKGSSDGPKRWTVYMPALFHPEAIKYARTKFNLLQPGEGLTQEECLAQADGLRTSFFAHHLTTFFLPNLVKPYLAYMVTVMRVGKLPESQLNETAAPRLRIIARNGTGVDMIHKETCLKRGIVVTNQPGGNAQAVAELALTLILTLLRRVVEVNQRLRSGERVPSISVLAPGLYGKVVGLVGMGDIAYELAKLLVHGFNCKIIIYSPTSPPTKWTTSCPSSPSSAIPHKRCPTLAQLLPQIDVLSLHCPLIPETKHLISTRQLALFGPSAVVVNTARGGIVDESALLLALQRGQIAGAGIDVWESEPPTLATSDTCRELMGRRDVVALPHLGGSTDEVTRVGCMNAVDICWDYLEGGAPRNRVY
ncbi:hypothetical protein QFC21_002703 [Naganishia friedmannii]|uniref:Uncharacterized protein n=1 Tax=Naganishia friedmannii TaxID=89922 RepID=A0ACC2VW07_9TREE|nr:hypothetical protein QFC21_002703 [Naganishia friedmannii]